MRTLHLTHEDQALLDSFRLALRERFGDVAKSITVYGSKARGEATEESDLDLLLLIEEGDWRLKWDIADVAYDLAIGTNVVPSVKVLTIAEWDRLREMESVFREEVERDGVLV
jgi:predicted nucleotidyltransferase